MGEAKRRGTKEERVAKAIERDALMKKEEPKKETLSPSQIMLIKTMQDYLEK